MPGDDMDAEFAKLGPKTTTWRELERSCHRALRYIQVIWKVVPPDYSVPEPAGMKDAAGTACLKFLADPTGRLVDDEAVKPWVAARLLYAASLCDRFAKTGRSIPGDPRETLKILLVGDWQDRPAGMWKAKPVAS